MPSEAELIEVLESSRAKLGALCIAKLKPIQSRIDVDDVAQIVAVRALHSLDQATGDLHGWVYRIAQNVTSSCLTAHFADKRSMARTVSDDVIDLAAERALPVNLEGVQLVDLQDELAAVEAAIESELSPAQAKAVRMRYLELAEYTEVAAAMDCSVNAARCLVAKGLEKVRRRLSCSE